MRRGQAAMEYIVTYGWAFLVILVVIGGLAYFGVITPSRWVPERCDFGAQLECKDYQLFTEKADLFFLNNFGKDISITGVQMRMDDGSLSPTLSMTDTVGGSPVTTIDISAGATGDVILTLPSAADLTAGEKQQVTLVITFQRNPGGSPHTLTGTVYAKVKES